MLADQLDNQMQVHKQVGQQREMITIHYAIWHDFFLPEVIYNLLSTNVDVNN